MLDSISFRQLAALALTALLTGACATAESDRDTQVQYTLDESTLPPVNRFQLTDLDASTDVCVDLGAYVNAKWLAANTIPADRTSWGAFAMLDERSLAVRHQLAEQVSRDSGASGVARLVGDFYSSGMDEQSIEEQGIKPLEARLASIEAVSDRAGLAAWLRDAFARGEGELFSFGPEADFTNSSMNIAFVVPGGLGLPDRAYYFDADKADKLAAYQKHIAKVLELSGVEAAAAADQAKAVIDFETRLAKVSKSAEELSRDVSLYFNPVSPSDADKVSPNFPWTEFFASQGLQLPEKFSLAIPEFHGEVNRMLAEEPLPVWKSYLRFHVVDDASPYLSREFVDESFDFYSRIMRGQQEQRERWKRVLGSIEGNVGEAFGQLYVSVAFPPESKARMEKLVGNLRTALKARIENLDWMGDSTKAKALEKWASFTPKIGYPDKWRDWTGLNTTRESYFANIAAAREFNYRWELSKIDKPVDKTEWGMTPQTVNAYYNPLRNEIVFPAAILQPPFFDPDADDAINYGGIGAVIGHEMTHGYDDQGSRFGPTGNFENWWTEQDARDFAARTDKLVQQFNGYEALPGQFVNGNLTLGENIADLGGLATSYDALHLAVGDAPDPETDGLTRDQRFFLSWATIWRNKITPESQKVQLAVDPHAPAAFRVIGPVSNMPAFAAAFGCAAGSAMVRSDAARVVIW